MTKHIHVAVGVIKNANNEILLALRPQSAHQGGLWEFPGGKVEPQETVQQALVRELQEEVAIVATGLKPLMDIRHDYSDKSVHLDVWWVDAFEGEPHGREGQPLEWVAASALTEKQFPAANKAIVEAVQSALA
jgi:8-oxo-dGTP diphosphatase